MLPPLGLMSADLSISGATRSANTWVASSVRALWWMPRRPTPSQWIGRRGSVAPEVSSARRTRWQFRAVLVAMAAGNHPVAMAPFSTVADIRCGWLGFWSFLSSTDAFRGDHSARPSRSPTRLPLLPHRRIEALLALGWFRRSELRTGID